MKAISRTNRTLATAITLAVSVFAALAPTAAAAADMTEAEVRKLDMDTGKVTLKHGEIKSLDMPAMTMVFQVRDTTLLEKITAGDRIRFTAEQQQGAYVLTHVEQAAR